MASDDRPAPLADDEDFLASLGALDEGLMQSGSSPARALPPLPPVKPSPDGSSRRLLDLFPADGLALSSQRERPFNLSSDPRYVYHSEAHDRAAQALLGAIWRREGIVVLTGEAGAGKTTLCRSIIEQLDRRTLTSFVPDASVSVDELLKAVLLDFGVISRDERGRGRLAGATAADLLHAFRSFLAGLAPLQAFAVIILDEAQALSINVLEHLRLVVEADPMAENRHLLQIVLVGEPVLLDALARPELRALSGRIGVRAALGRLLPHEVGGYIEHRLAGSQPELQAGFDEEALVRVYQITRGVPRLVNVVCDRAIALARSTSASVVGSDLVGRAAADLDPPPVEIRPARIRAVVLVALVLLMMVAGAAIAAWVFADRFTALVQEWRNGVG